MRRYISLLLFIGLAWGQALTIQKESDTIEINSNLILTYNDDNSKNDKIIKTVGYNVSKNKENLEVAYFRYGFIRTTTFPLQSINTIQIGVGNNVKRNSLIGVSVNLLLFYTVGIFDNKENGPSEGNWPVPLPMKIAGSIVLVSPTIIGYLSGIITVDKYKDPIIIGENEWKIVTEDDE